jgi:hypothetical protein
MRIFIIGLPKSGRTTVSKAVAEAGGFGYIDAMSWIRSTFRPRKEGEHSQQYEDEYQQYLTKRMMVNPNFISDHVQEMMKVGGHDNFVIDGIVSPKDFMTLFNYQQDIVVFLNRTDEDPEGKDYEKIGVSVARDYCYWMSAANLLTKDRWLEYNFKIPGEDSAFVKAMGTHNSVFIVRSINKVISHLSNKLKEVAQK